MGTLDLVKELAKGLTALTKRVAALEKKVNASPPPAESGE